jgi:WD40 repeat protein
MLRPTPVSASALLTLGMLAAAWPLLDAPHAVGQASGEGLPVGAVARFGTVRWRHADVVNFVGFALDDKAILTAARDGSIRLWDRHTGEELRRFTDAPPASTDAFTGVRLAGMQPPGATMPALSADGKILATVVPGNGIRLSDVATAKELRVILIKAPTIGLAARVGVATLLFAPDGKMLAARTADNKVHVLDVNDGREVRLLAVNLQVTVRTPFAATSGLAFAPDGKELASVEVELDQQKLKVFVRLTDLATGSERRVKVDAGVAALAYAPDGKLLALSDGSSIRLIDPTSADDVRRIATGSAVTMLAFGADGRTLVGRGPDPLVRRWDSASGKELPPLGERDPLLPMAPAASFTLAPRSSAQELAFSRDGSLIASAFGHSVRVWDAASGKEHALGEGHRATVTAVSIAPDSRTVLSRGADGAIRRWHAGKGAVGEPFQEPPGCAGVAWSADGRTFALGNADSSIRLYDAGTGKELHRVSGHQGGATAMAFSPDGRLLASRGVSDNAIVLCDAVKGVQHDRFAVTGSVPTPGVVLAASAFVPQPLALAYSGDGRTIAANVGSFQPVAAVAAAGMPAPGPSTLRMWDVASGKPLRQISMPPERGVGALAFAPDRRVLASENADQSVSLWEIASGKERARFGGQPPRPPAPPTASTLVVRATVARGVPAAATMALSPDGCLLACVGPKHAINIWDVRAGKEIAQLQGHAAPLTALAFAPDGKTLASGSKDTTVVVWDIAALKREPTPPSLELQRAELEALWAQLLRDDAVSAYRAIATLSRAPAAALPLLREQLKPAVPVAPEHLAQLVADVASDSFAVRQKALAELAMLGDLAVPALRKLVADRTLLEAVRRVEPLLEKAATGSLSAEQVRLVRGVEVLENLQSPDARTLLIKLAAGAPGALLTREAEAALQRLTRRATN